MSAVLESLVTPTFLMYESNDTIMQYIEFQLQDKASKNRVWQNNWYLKSLKDLEEVIIQLRNELVVYSASTGNISLPTTSCTDGILKINA